MLPSDLIKRVVTAHNRAVKAAQVFECVTRSTRKSEIAWLRYENAEKKFEAAMAALVDSAA